MNYLTLTKLRAHVTHALADGSVPAALDQDDVINDAGRAFYNSHPWNFRYRPPVDLDFRSGERWIDLPYDFGELVAYQTANNYGITLTTPQGLANHRWASTTVAQNYYWATIVQPSQRAISEPPPPPRMEIWPQPSATVVAAVQVWYRAKWTLLGEDSTVVATDVADVPEYAEAALIQFVRAFAAGWFERLLEPSGGVDGMLERVMKGPVWGAAVTADGLTQPDYGPMMGGAIESRDSHFTWRSRTASAVADPS